MKNQIKLLEDYFSKRQDISFAFLFGSKSKKTASKISDWDIGVYFVPQDPRQVEWQDIDRDYPHEDEIRNDLMDILKTDNVDLIVLNRAPASIGVASINGTVLAMKDRKIFLEFMLRVTQEAEDFRNTVSEYSKVYWRSKSLSDFDREIITRRLTFLNSEIAEALSFDGLNRQEYENNGMKRRAVERWIENLMNASIDIAKVILASQKLPIPPSYREVLRMLHTLPGFPPELAGKLSTWAELRNILAHEYLDIRWKRIEEFIKDGPALLNKFLDAVRGFTEETH